MSRFPLSVVWAQTSLICMHKKAQELENCPRGNTQSCFLLLASHTDLPPWCVYRRPHFLLRSMGYRREPQNRSEERSKVTHSMAENTALMDLRCVVMTASGCFMHHLILRYRKQKNTHTNTPCVSLGTRVWESRAHLSKSRRHSGSVSALHSAQSPSWRWNPCICGSAHHCTLFRAQTQKHINHYQTNLYELFAAVRVCVSPTSYYKVGVREEVLGLHESTSVSRVEQVKDAICVDSDRPVHWKHTATQQHMH